MTEVVAHAMRRGKRKARHDQFAEFAFFIIAFVNYKIALRYIT